jgi:TolB-like protein/cytochrome c-type biogenesis protein CcmH/NrfG
MDGGEGVALSGAERGRNVMKPERWEKVIDLFQSALERAPEERAAFLDEACHDDEGMRREVESLLISHERAENFIEVPAFEVAPELATNDSAGALVGKLIGHYRIESLIGVGGMGEVYLARDERLGRKAALKLLPDSLTTDETQLGRFKNEARTASALNHPNILTVYEIGVEGNRQFIATEFIEGITLRASLAGGRINPHAALEIAVQVASALAAAHDAGVVHRDIKPENIMLRPDGYVKVLDFGIAKLTEQRRASDDHRVETTTLLQTRPGLLLGTAHYMSPEQARGQKVDARSDIWSLGVVLYEIVTGSPPFRGETPSDCIAAILTTEPAPLSSISPDVPAKLESILQKALRKNTDERYQTIKEMLAELRILNAKLEAESSLSQTKARAESIVSKIKRYKRGVLLTLAAAILAAAAVAYSFFFVAPAPLPNEKSIAVLPFENRSEEKANAYFADGIQDEILTRLSKLADLKVISRTSVVQYKTGVVRNLREIGHQLGISHVVEGSVQRAANRVRVNVQLLDARTDAHLWAQTYDRDLADVFAIQSEIAQAIADQLQAKLSPKDKEAIMERPTKDLAAYDLYLRAKELISEKYKSVNASRYRENYLKAVQLLDQAIARDPAFLLAHCQLAYAHDLIYLFDIDHTETRLASAEASVKAAIQLQPDSGETHLAQAIHFYWGYRNYDRARQELAKAERTLPNNSRIFSFLGLIDRRQGRWGEAIRNLERAVDLDPRNATAFIDLGLLYFNLRRYGESIAMYNRALTLEPRNIRFRIFPPSIALDAEANPAPLRAVINTIEAEGPSSAAEAAENSFRLALYERDPVGAARALANFPSQDNIEGFHFPDAWYEGLLAKLRQDVPGTHSAFKAARAEAEKIVRAQPGSVQPMRALALIDAELGQKEKAIQEGRAACDMLPVEKDAVTGVTLITALAEIYALTGEKDLALQQLEIVSKLPAGPTYGELRLDPVWDALRGDLRFEKIVASLAPKKR